MKHSLNYTITASGTSPIEYAAYSLPIGLKLTGNVISGVPNSAGVTAVALTAKNGIKPDDTQTLNIAIIAPGTPTYRLTVVGGILDDGTTSGLFPAGSYVNIYAIRSARSSSRSLLGEFIKWITKAVDLIIQGITDTRTTCIMPAHDCTVEATFVKPGTISGQINIRVGSALIKPNAIVNITADAELPKISAVFDSKGSISATTEVNWQMKVIYNANLAFDSKHRPISAKFDGLGRNHDVIDISSGSSKAVSEIWVINDDLVEVCGGSALVTCRLNATGEALGSFAFIIRGTNPQPSAIPLYIASLPDAPWFAASLLRVESSGNIQFYTKTIGKEPLAKGIPLETFDGGYGIAQLTTPSYVNSVRKWSWKENVKFGLITVISEKERSAVNWLVQQRAQAKKDNNGIDVPIPDYSIGKAVFSDTLAPGTHRFEDAIAIRLYNGMSTAIGDFKPGATIDRVNVDDKRFVEWDSTSLKWVFWPLTALPINRADPNAQWVVKSYLEQVCQ